MTVDHPKAAADVDVPSPQGGGQTALGEATSIYQRTFTRESAIQGVVAAVVSEGRRLDRLRQDFPDLWQAVMALVGYEMMRPVGESARSAEA